LARLDDCRKIHDRVYSDAALDRFPSLVVILEDIVRMNNAFTCFRKLVDRREFVANGEREAVVISRAYLLENVLPAFELGAEISSVARNVLSAAAVLPFAGFAIRRRGHFCKPRRLVADHEHQRAVGFIK